MTSLQEPAIAVVVTAPQHAAQVFQKKSQPVVVQGAAAMSQRVNTLQREPVVIRQDRSLVVANASPRTAALVRQGFAGPQGIPGPASGPATITATAATNLTYPCVVAIVDGVAHYADPASTADMTAQLAITTQAAFAGAQVVCATELTLTEMAWNWSPGRIYLSDTPGQLSQTPAAAAVLEVARATTPTTLEFDIHPALLRAA